MTPAKAPANQPIDAVYTWGGEDQTVLRSSLRSLGRYAPWIRKVYVVTGAQAPAWLSGDRPRLSLVRHEDIFRDRSVLPASNPEAIAWQLFRIPGLSRQFLHLDHNFFLGRRLDPADFLTPKGGNRFYVEPSDIPLGSIAESLLNSRFGNRSPRKKPVHMPRFLDRNFLEEVNRLWEKPIEQCGVSLETLYFYYLVECPQQYGIHEKAAVTPEIFRVAPLSEAKQIAEVLSSRPRFFCLEGGTPPMLTRVLLKLYYWRGSCFEK